MSKRCPQCGRSNEDAMHFCAYCSAALDSNVKLLMDLEKRRQTQSPRSAVRDEDEDEDEIIRPVRRQEKKSKAPWIILVLAVAAAAVWFLFFR